MTNIFFVKSEARLVIVKNKTNTKTFDLLRKLHSRAFDWYQNQPPWMTLI